MLLGVQGPAYWTPYWKAQSRGAHTEATLAQVNLRSLHTRPDGLTLPHKCELSIDVSYQPSVVALCLVPGCHIMHVATP